MIVRKNMILNWMILLTILIVKLILAKRLGVSSGRKLISKLKYLSLYKGMISGGTRTRILTIGQWKTISFLVL